MLSIERTRELIEDSEIYSDEEIERIRDDVYALAEIALDSYFEELKRESNKSEYENVTK